MRATIGRLGVAASMSLVIATSACGGRSQLFDVGVVGHGGGSGPDGGEALQTNDAAIPVDAPPSIEASISPPEAGISPSRPCVMLGSDIDQPTSTTWIWDGSAWTQRHPSVSPNSRTSATAAALDGTMMVFGGYESVSNGTTYGNDTWTWDGTTWTQQSPSESPPAVASAAAATLNGKTYLFGGINPGFVYGDTWEWDGSNWTHLSPARSPPARGYATLVSDGSRLILFGGQSADNASTDFLDDTWAWDGTTWTQLEPAGSPPPRRAAAAAQLGNSFVLFGGQALGNDPYGPLSYLGDTWTWQGGSWTQMTPAVTPPSRSFAAMASPGTAVVMAGGFRPPPDGGYVYLDDTWTWDGALWTEHATASHPDGLDFDGAVMTCP